MQPQWQRQQDQMQEQARQAQQRLQQMQDQMRQQQEWLDRQREMAGWAEQQRKATPAGRDGRASAFFTLLWLAVLAFLIYQCLGA
ncbi:MAG: hypothetical protein H3C34_15310 [Caldilineaceae bacterium]|nr:hypothetical protein [Caldilineaceae bacterium]